jgi:hypothetical protein
MGNGNRSQGDYGYLPPTKWLVANQTVPRPERTAEIITSQLRAFSIVPSGRAILIA